MDRQTPQGTFEKFTTAFAEEDYETYLAMMTEAHRAETISNVVTSIMAMRGTPQEADSTRQRERLEQLEAILEENGVRVDPEALVDAAEPDETFHLRVYEAVEDPPGLFGDFLAWRREDPEEAPSTEPFGVEGELDELQLDATGARGKLVDGEVRRAIRFELIEGKWYIAKRGHRTTGQ